MGKDVVVERDQKPVPMIRANDAYSSYISKYDYKVNKDGTLSHGNETFNVLGNIHTHQERTTDPKPSVSEYGGEDLAISRRVDHGDGSTDHFFSKGFGEVQKNVYLCKR